MGHKQAMPSHMCPICGKILSRSTKLTEHVRSHTGEKPFKCSTCRVSFSRSYDLTKHRQLHGNSYKYKCEGEGEDNGTIWGCGKRFHKKGDLNRHLNRGNAKKCRQRLSGERSTTSNHVRKSAQATITDTSKPLRGTSFPVTESHVVQETQDTDSTLGSITGEQQAKLSHVSATEVSESPRLLERHSTIDSSPMRNGEVETVGLNIHQSTSRSHTQVSHMTGRPSQPSSIGHSSFTQIGENGSQSDVSGMIWNDTSSDNHIHQNAVMSWSPSIGSQSTAYQDMSISPHLEASFTKDAFGFPTVHKLFGHYEGTHALQSLIHNETGTSHQLQRLSTTRQWASELNAQSQPRAVPPRSRDAGLVAYPLWHQSPRVLLVECDHIVRPSTEHLLHSLQCRFDSVSNYVERLAYAARIANLCTYYDLVLLDATLLGDDILFGCVSSLVSIPIIPMVPRGRKTTAMHTYSQYGICDVLAKPLTKTSLSYVMEKYLDHLRRKDIDKDSLEQVSAASPASLGRSEREMTPLLF